MAVVSGPAQGAVLTLDLRINGSYWLGRYDNWILRKVRISDWLPSGGVAWDCGSYVGYYAAIFRKVVGDGGTVVAFEASSTNYDLLRHMPRLNNWSNVQVMNRAVGPERTMLDFAGELGGSSGPHDAGMRTHAVTTHPVVSCGVDELCFDHCLPPPDFVKLDLEGAETHALHNGGRLFSGKRPVVLLELHGTQAVAALGRFLKEYRYRCWDVRYFDIPASVPFRDAASIAQAGFELCNTMICLPEEMTPRRDAILASR